LAALVTFCRGNLAALLRGATPTYYLTGGFDGQVQGIALSVGLTGEQQRIECNKLSLRPAMPLQTTLFSLVEATAQVLRNRRVPAAACQTAPLGLTVLVDPVPQGSLAHPDLAGIDPRRRAVLVRDAVRSAWVFDPARSVEELLEEAARMADVRSPAAAAVATLAAVSTEPRAAFVQGTQPRGDGEVRPPAVAGTFYPGRPEQVEQALDELFAEPPRPEPWAGAMVPHAGWKYSGSLAAAVFSRVQIPPQVIVFCPRHHPGGAQWAVAPHRRWLLPGREIESDPELAARLTAGVSGLELDAVPHRQEHAIEVQLPLLARVAPQTRVVGVTIGGGELSSLFQFAAELAAVLRELPQRPLLVISSDMNHFADDTQTRQIDALALEAMQSLDPSLLYRTVREHRISMCGMLPAVLVMETLRQLGALTRCELVGYATSADASGDTHRVVGYAGMLLG
jgi:AmmeMemoRadiSam system protein B